MVNNNTDHVGFYNFYKILTFKHIPTKTLTLLLCCFVVAFTFTTTSCDYFSKKHIISGAERDSIKNSIEGIIHKNKENKYLENLLTGYTIEHNSIGIILVCKTLGKNYREQTDFKNAIDIHQKGLNVAEADHDTIEIVQALNNIGTNYRRLGDFDKGAYFHYKALTICEQYSKKSCNDVLKSRTISLNGIGNIFLTLDNYQKAKEYFFESVEIEKMLKSDLGLAINYANIGSIFEAQGMLDSAMTYYRISMHHNQLCKSELGIALCYIHFGNIYESKGELRKASDEFLNAYNTMLHSDDKWHWLEACIPLSRVLIALNQNNKANEYLNEAKKVSYEIKSKEHIMRVHDLLSQSLYNSGRYKEAFKELTIARSYKDSIHGDKKLSSFSDTRVEYEKQKGEYEIALLKTQNQLQERSKKMILIVASIVLILLISIIVVAVIGLRLKIKERKTIEKLEKMRSNFFTNITHEFRTPISVILGLSEHLRKPFLDQKNISLYLDAISRQGNNLLSLVNQLMDISKVRSQIGNPEWKSCEAVIYIKMIVDSYRLFAEDKNLQIKFHSSEREIIIDTVPSYFEKIIGNLLNNAIKYSNKGDIIVNLRLDKNNIIISIKDPGIGISETDLPYIFEPFFQGENSNINIGTGVGLSLVYQLVKSMGGDIVIESKLDEGSTFTVTLPQKHGKSEYSSFIPIVERHPSTAPIQKEVIVLSEEKSDNNATTILLAEDNEDVALYIEALLKENYNIITAFNGVQALEKANKIVPDLIITDLMMPEMDGYELCKQIRSSKILNHIPIIIITAKSKTSNKLQGITSGADAYLTKPFDTEELHIRITSLLENRKLLKEKYCRSILKGDNSLLLNEDENSKFVRHITDFILKKINDTILSAVDIANEMNMTTAQLNRKMVAITGYTTSGYLSQVRIDKAK